MFEAIALVAVVLTQYDVWTNIEDDRTRFAGIVLVAAGALVFRRRAPFAAPLVLGRGRNHLLAARSERRLRHGHDVLPLVLAGWAAGALTDRRQAITAFAAVLVAGWTVFIRAPDVPWTELIWLSFPLTGIFVISAAATRHSERARIAEERARRTEEEARQAVAEERSRITRELHDILAHSVSVMTVQASAVRRLLTPEQEREREALLTVEETGRKALAEMRRLLGIMRSDEEVAGARAPARARDAADARGAGAPSGLPVELSVEGQAVDLPAGVDLSAYRIVQEALTNTLKHAGPAQALGPRPVCRRGGRDRGRERRSRPDRQRRRRPRPGRDA